MFLFHLVKKYCHKITQQFGFDVAIGSVNKFAVATNRTTTQGLLFQYRSIMFYDRLEYSRNSFPTYSVPDDKPDPSNLALPSVMDYLHISLLYCKGQRKQGYI